jgi:hypothetical protein
MSTEIKIELRPDGTFRQSSLTKYPPLSAPVQALLNIMRRNMPELPGPADESKTD